MRNFRNIPDFISIPSIPNSAFPCRKPLLSPTVAAVRKKIFEDLPQTVSEIMLKEEEEEVEEEKAAIEKILYLSAAQHQSKKFIDNWEEFMASNTFKEIKFSNQSKKDPEFVAAEIKTRLGESSTSTSMQKKNSKIGMTSKDKKSKISPKTPPRSIRSSKEAKLSARAQQICETLSQKSVKSSDDEAIVMTSDKEPDDTTSLSEHSSKNLFSDSSKLGKNIFYSQSILYPKGQPIVFSKEFKTIVTPRPGFLNSSESDLFYLPQKDRVPSEFNNRKSPFKLNSTSSLT